MNLLIKPASFRMLGTTPPPLGLLYMAGQDDNTVVWDSVIHGDPRHSLEFFRYDVVGVQMYTTSRHDSLSLLKHAKENGCITVVGGPHVAPMRKQLEHEYDFIDFIVSGDGEIPWQMITKYAQDRGPELKKHIRHLTMNLDELSLPNWNAIGIRDYNPQRINAVISRGCTGQCVYCAAWWVNGPFRHHGAHWITEHLTLLGARGVKHLVFQDDCLTNTESAYNALTEALAKCPTKFRWRGTTRVDAITQEQIRDLRKLGCYSLGFGIESGSQTILDKINKGADLERAIQVRQWCKHENVQFKALMMSGFPFETDETRREDAAFRKRLAPDEWGSVGHIIVLPGTKLYRDLKREGKITDDFWLGPEPYYRLG